MPTNKNRVTFILSDETKDALEAYANDHEQSMSAVVTSLCRNFLISEGYLQSKKLARVARVRKT